MASAFVRLLLYDCSTKFPVWVLSLGLWKAFDRVHWGALWLDFFPSHPFDRWESPFFASLPWWSPHHPHRRCGAAGGRLGVSERAVSTHVVWILRKPLFGHHAQNTGQKRNRCTFQINVGVRQGCVLSLKMLSSVLHRAISKWRTWAEGRRMFVWICSWNWLAIFKFEICKWHLDLREVFPWNHDVVGQTG